MTDSRRAIPSVETLLSAPEMQPLLEREPRARVAEALRKVQQDGRANGSHGHGPAWYAERTAQRLQQRSAMHLQHVINATGVILHTNLGRAPLADAAVAAIGNAAAAYSNLEYDVGAKTRGSRYDHCRELLRETTGAEDALVVNNNAAALVLALNTFAADRDAIVSRGELVEIGGSFRIPDIMERSGARLCEVGSTNRTHISDYAGAMSERTGAVLKVHRSNFHMSGFVSEVTAAQLGEVAAAGAGAVVIHDLGSGLIEDLSDLGLKGEPTAREATRALPHGIITMSGDKLLGGPQAGILLGPSALVQRMKTNPLCRALRVDKLTIAALQATLEIYARGAARREIPVLRMASMDQSAIRTRAEKLAEGLRAHGVATRLVDGASSIGGGAFPAAELATTLLVIDVTGNAAELEARLRAAAPPVIARLVDNRVALDLRTVQPREEAALVEAIVAATS